jgi:hypothetical protein
MVDPFNPGNGVRASDAGLSVQRHATTAATGSGVPRDGAPLVALARRRYAEAAAASRRHAVS